MLTSLSCDVVSPASEVGKTEKSVLSLMSLEGGATFGALFGALSSSRGLAVGSFEGVPLLNGDNLGSLGKPALIGNQPEGCADIRRLELAQNISGLAAVR